MTQAEIEGKKTEAFLLVIHCRSFAALREQHARLESVEAELQAMQEQHDTLKEEHADRHAELEEHKTLRRVG